MNRYSFDVKCFAGISVDADSPEAAVALIKEHMDACTCAARVIGEFELSVDGEPELVEINGEWIA